MPRLARCLVRRGAARAAVARCFMDVVVVGVVVEVEVVAAIVVVVDVIVVAFVVVIAAVVVVAFAVEIVVVVEVEVVAAIVVVVVEVVEVLCGAERSSASLRSASRVLSPARAAARSRPPRELRASAASHKVHATASSRQKEGQGQSSLAPVGPRQLTCPTRRCSRALSSRRLHKLARDH